MSAALLTTKQIAAETLHSIRSVERWRETGEGPPWVRIGRRKVGYGREEFEAWKASRTFRHRAEELSRNPETKSAGEP